MKNSDKIRAQFEERYPVPSGMRWEPGVGPAGDYILADVQFCSVHRAGRYIARWEAARVQKGTGHLLAEGLQHHGWARDVGGRRSLCSRSPRPQGD